jgi:hypothetical protein
MLTDHHSPSPTSLSITAKSHHNHAPTQFFSSKALIISLATGTRPQPNPLAANTFFNERFA